MPYTSVYIKAAYFNANFPAGMKNQDYDNLGVLQRWVNNVNKIYYSPFNPHKVPDLDLAFIRNYTFTASTMIPLQFQLDGVNVYGGEGLGLQIRISPYANIPLDPNGSSTYGLCTPFEWYSKLNPYPVVEAYWTCNVWTPAPTTVYDISLRLYLVMFHAIYYDIIQMVGMDSVSSGISNTIYQSNTRPTNGFYKIWGRVGT